MGQDIYVAIYWGIHLEAPTGTNAPWGDWKAFERALCRAQGKRYRPGNLTLKERLEQMANNTTESAPNKAPGVYRVVIGRAYWAVDSDHCGYVIGYRFIDEIIFGPSLFDPLPLRTTKRMERELQQFRVSEGLDEKPGLEQRWVIGAPLWLLSTEVFY